MAVPSEKEKMLRGELYYAFTDELMASRARCKEACTRFNAAGEVSRRRRVELWRDVVVDGRPLPPIDPDPKRDAAQFDETDPLIEAPITVDHGFNLRVSAGSMLNFNCIVLDTCMITIGKRTLVGPNVCFYSATHPLDPAIRQGLQGPEGGKEIHVEDDCWIGGNAVILPGVRIGKGSTGFLENPDHLGIILIGLQDVPPFHVVAGNPARIIRKVNSEMDPTRNEESNGKTLD
ncbi:MAG: hypothetical protein M1819_000255 [Sarea resinae]|nr:MAG: hypothetical protein M1819_000255 [Sarea resinae]